jgi:hypothetical protein
MDSRKNIRIEIAGNTYYKNKSNYCIDVSDGVIGDNES